MESSVSALPPGQRAIDDFPRFGVPYYADRLPTPPAKPSIEVDGEVARPMSMDLSELSLVPRIEVEADFHCVTTWTRRGLRWSGFRFREVMEKLIGARADPAPGVRYVQFRCLDGCEACIDLRDALSDDMLLADRCDDAPLSPEHGAPLRFVAPALYAYKSAKHVCGIRFLTEYRRGFAERQTFAHPRGRVALEERGRLLPGWFFRHLYRAFIGRTLRRYRGAATSRGGGTAGR